MNTNCLQNRACPKCGQSQEFVVLSTTWVSVTDDGSDPYADATKGFDGTQWDENSEAECPRCKYHGSWSEFDWDANPAAGLAHHQANVTNRTEFWTPERCQTVYEGACGAMGVPPENEDDELQSMVLHAIDCVDPEDEMGPYNSLADTISCLQAALEVLDNPAEATDEQE